MSYMWCPPESPALGRLRQGNFREFRIIPTPKVLQMHYVYIMYTLTEIMALGQEGTWLRPSLHNDPSGPLLRLILWLLKITKRQLSPQSESISKCLNNF